MESDSRERQLASLNSLVLLELDDYNYEAALARNAQALALARQLGGQQFTFVAQLFKVRREIITADEWNTTYQADTT